MCEQCSVEFQNVVAPFDDLVWAGVAGMLVAVSVSFLVIYHGYSKIGVIAPQLGKVGILRTTCKVLT